MSIEITIHGTGNGVCSLTGKDGDGLTVSFGDKTVSNAFLSWKGFRQLLAMKTTKNGKPSSIITIDPRPEAESGQTESPQT